MQKIITTERFYLREFIIEDAPHFYNLNNDPEVVKYTGDVPFQSIAEAEDFIKNYNVYKKYGFGRWAVCNKEHDEFLGFCGLKYHKEDNFIEVGYRFFQKHWNKGIATETANACIQYCFDELKAPEIYCQVLKENKASIRVAEKLGFEFVKYYLDDGNDACLFRKKNPNIQTKLITAKETYSVRHPVLRKGRPIEACAFENDEAPTTFHLGLFLASELVAVATFLENNNPIFNHSNQFQLRGMAVLEHHQRKGYGDILMKKGEAIIKEKNGAILWFNAREIAVSFYERLGFQKNGTPFSIPKIGIHYIMSKKYKK